MFNHYGESALPRTVIIRISFKTSINRFHQSIQTFIKVKAIFALNAKEEKKKSELVCSWKFESFNIYALEHIY